MGTAMRARLIGCLILAMASVHAQITVIESIFSEPDILGFTGDTDADPICLERLSDGRFVFFDTEPGVDALIVYDEIGDSFLEIASEAELLALAPNTTTPVNVNVSDIARNASDEIYLVVSETTEGPDYDNFIVKVPLAGGVFQVPVLATDLFDGGKSGLGDLVYHRIQVDPVGNRLFILFDNLSNTNDMTITPGSNGVHTFDLSLMPGSTSDLVMLTPHFGLASVVTPASTPGTDAIGLNQIRVNATGTYLYGVNTLGTGNADGDIVRIDTSDGSASLFLEQASAESSTANSGQFQSLTALAVNPSSENIVLLETGTSTADNERIYEYAPDGTFLGIVHSHDQITDAVSLVSSNFDMMVTNAMTVAPNGDIFVLMHQQAETLIRAHSTLVHPHAGSPEWIWPLLADTSPRLTSGYGPRRFAVSDPRYDWHRGIDVPLPIGTRIYAVGDGVARLSGPTVGFSDPVVQVRHGAGASAIYSTNLHMSGWFFDVNDPVAKGDLVGLSGTSVNNFDHLHFEIRDGGVNQDSSQNPVGYLPTVDTVPPTPSLVGANLDPSGTLLLFDFDTPRTEIDIDGIHVAWGLSDTVFSFNDVNLGNPGVAGDLDHPPLTLPDGTRVATFLDRTSTDYLYRMAVWNLDPLASSGSVDVRDVDSAGAPLALSPSLPTLSLTPAVQSSATLAGGQAVFNHTLENTGGSAVSATLSARSAQNNSLSLSPLSVNLAPGATQAVTLTVDHGAAFPVGIGDCIVIEIDGGTSQNLIAIDTIGDPIAVPAGLVMLGED